MITKTPDLRQVARTTAGLACAGAMFALPAAADIVDEGSIAINTNASTCEVSLNIAWSADPFRVGAINEQGTTDADDRPMVYSGVLGDLRFIGLKDQTNSTSPQVMDEIVAALPNDAAACENGLAAPESTMDSFFGSFPAGDYPFFASSISLERGGITSPLTHVIPAAPNVTFPDAGALLPRKGFTVRWKKVSSLMPTFPDAFAAAGITDADVSIASYKVQLDQLTVGGAPAAKTILTAEVDKRRMRIPGVLLKDNASYEVTVWQVDAGGNQTSVTVPFSTE